MPARMGLEFRLSGEAWTPNFSKEADGTPGSELWSHGGQAGPRSCPTARGASALPFAGRRRDSQVACRVLVNTSRSPVGPVELSCIAKLPICAGRVSVTASSASPTHWQSVAVPWHHAKAPQLIAPMPTVSALGGAILAIRERPACVFQSWTRGAGKFTKDSVFADTPRGSDTWYISLPSIEPWNIKSPEGFQTFSHCVLRLHHSTSILLQQSIYLSPCLFRYLVATMVRILSAVAFVLALAVGAQAAATCQCLFSDGSHCCVYVVSPSAPMAKALSSLTPRVLPERQRPRRGLHQRLPRQAPVDRQRRLRRQRQVVQRQRLERPVPHRLCEISLVVWLWGTGGRSDLGQARGKIKNGIYLCQLNKTVSPYQFTTSWWHM